MSGPEIGFMGAIRNVAVWNRALNESEAVDFSIKNLIQVYQTSKVIGLFQSPMEMIF